MHCTFYVIVVIEIITNLASAEFIVPESGIHSSEYAEWNAEYSGSYESWPSHHEETYDGCLKGRCLRVTDCPRYAAACEPTGACAYLDNGPWVCCVFPVENNVHFPKVTNTYLTKPSVKPTEGDNDWKHAGFPAWWRKRTLKPEDRKSTTLKSTTKNSWHNDGNEYVTIPYGVENGNRNNQVTHSATPAWKKTTTSSWSRQTLPVRGGSTTKFPLSYSSKKTTADPWNRQTTPSPLNKKTVDPSHKSSTQDSRIKFTTDTFHKSTTSTKRGQVTRPTLSPWTKITGSHLGKSTTSAWGSQPTRSSVATRDPWKVTTRRSVTTVRPTRSSTTRTTSTTNGVRTNEIRTESGDKRLVGKSTTMHSNDRRTSTKKYTVTTPLPNTNTQICGIRDKMSKRSRSRRSFRQMSESEVEIIDLDSTSLSSKGVMLRIVGGEEAEPYSWPWIAALYKIEQQGGNRFLSSGSLINENFVLTAAHIFTPDDLKTVSYVVMLGTHTAKEGVAEYMVSKVLLHPNYEHRYYYHDIALLRLQRPARFNNYIMPVCLPSPNARLLKDSDLIGKNVTVMGWGDDSFGGKSSTVLKEATVTIMSRRTCNASYVQVVYNRFPRGITDQMLCAGHPDGGKDACQGDSGGPLTSVENGRHTQVGIVSFGYKCGDKDYPGVYTKVAHYIQWIDENVRNRNIG